MSPRSRRALAAKAPGSEATEVVEALKESWPDHPEWVDMLSAILDDEPMGPELRLVSHGRGADTIRLGFEPQAL